MLDTHSKEAMFIATFYLRTLASLAKCHLSVTGCCAARSSLSMITANTLSEPTAGEHMLIISFRYNPQPGEK